MHSLGSTGSNDTSLPADPWTMADAEEVPAVPAAPAAPVEPLAVAKADSEEPADLDDDVSDATWRWQWRYDVSEFERPKAWRIHGRIYKTYADNMITIIINTI